MLLNVSKATCGKQLVDIRFSLARVSWLTDSDSHWRHFRQMQKHRQPHRMPLTCWLVSTKCLSVFLYIARQKVGDTLWQLCWRRSQKARRTSVHTRANIHRRNSVHTGKQTHTQKTMCAQTHTQKNKCAHKQPHTQKNKCAQTQNKRAHMQTHTEQMCIDR